MSVQLWGLRKRGDFCDLVIKVQGTSVKCHKLVLVACSDYFASMFNTSHQFRENREGLSEVSLEADIYQVTIYAIYITIYHIYQGISVEVVESVLYYIYNGGLKSEVLTTQIQSVPDIYRLADLWQMEELTKLCAKIMVTNVDESSFLDLLRFSKVDKIQKGTKKNEL